MCLLPLFNSRGQSDVVLQVEADLLEDSDVNTLLATNPTEICKRCGDLFPPPSSFSNFTGKFQEWCYPCLLAWFHLSHRKQCWRTAT